MAVVVDQERNLYEKLIPDHVSTKGAVSLFWYRLVTSTTAQKVVARLYSKPCIEIVQVSATLSVPSDEPKVTLRFRVSARFVDPIHFYTYLMWKVQL